MLHDSVVASEAALLLAKGVTHPAERCRTLVYSRHGYGRSSLLDEPRRVNYMHEEARVWLPAILKRLGICRPVLFGHSDGASIALIHAASPGSELAGVIALAPHVKVEDISVRGIAAAKTAYLQTFEPPPGYKQVPAP